MRLIDADALIELFREVIGGIAKKPEMNGNLEHMVRSSAMVIEMIKDAPTVTERTGHWIYDTVPSEKSVTGFFYMHSAQCSECGTYVEVASNYCPNCGAHMKGGETE